MKNRKVQICIGIVILLIGALGVWYFGFDHKDNSARTIRTKPPGFGPAEEFRELPTYQSEKLKPKRDVTDQGPQFVMSIAMDLAGQIWAGSESEGIFCYKPLTDKWTRYTEQDGLGDLYGYAIAVDHQGRVWAGHLNRGVSVFNGEKWTNFDTMDVPVGERVFAIAVSPVDGDVWLGSNLALTRYSPQSDSWRTYTRADGLPSNSVSCIAFDKDGNVCVGTDCDGIAMAKAGENFANWKCVRGPDVLATSPTGDGLPFSHVNAVLMAKDGAIYVGTTHGLGVSRDGGGSWRYVRGLDAYFTRQTVGAKRFDPAYLLEDYVTCLAEGPGGLPCVGHRRRGWEIFDMAAGRRAGGAHGRDVIGHIRAIVPTPGGVYAATTEGLSVPIDAGDKRTVSAAVTDAKIPSKAPPPSVEVLTKLAGELEKVPQQPPGGPISLDDDWLTEGSWMGRYGKFWACLAGMSGGGDSVWAPGNASVWFNVGTPGHFGQGINHYVTQEQTDETRVLETRDEASVYGHGQFDHRRAMWVDWIPYEVREPEAIAGPNIEFSLGVPKGTFCLSLYETNAARQGIDACRDYAITVKEKSSASPAAHVRLHHFSSGVWKRFLVTGPAKYSILMERAGSANATLSGMMLDTLQEEPMPYFQTAEEFARDPDGRQKAIVAKSSASPENAARRVFAATENLRMTNPGWWAMHSRPIYRELAVYFAQGAGEDNQRILGICYMYLGRFELWEKCRERSGLRTARGIEQSLKWDAVSGSHLDKAYDIIRATVEAPATRPAK